MEIFDGHRALFRPLSSPAIAVGNFDGVHVGHQALIDEAVAAARDLGGDAVVYTFDPHPAAVLAPDRAPPLICTPERKLELIAARGIDACVIEPFTRELAAMEPDEFLQEVFVDILGARCVIVGYDFTYGHNRAGNADSLRAFGAARGIDVRIIEPVAIDHLVASSSAVRRAVRAAELPSASQLLGRDFDVDGPVVSGARRGRDLGYPTANVAHAAELLPPPGIYATWVEILDGEAPGELHAAATSLGTNPTFGAGAPLTLEAHLLDFEGDLYGRRLRVGFIEHLRDEAAFDGADALVAQIERDVARTREIFRQRTKS
jgi:riboflavin kinase/FMN adenylyltransferase